MASWGSMELKNNPVVAAVILGVFIVAAVLIYRYTSPFEQCVRGWQAMNPGYEAIRAYPYCKGA